MISNARVKVVNLNNKICSLEAVIDTGSPVSFVKPSVYLNYFESGFNLLEAQRSKFSALNDSHIAVIGKVESVICLETLPGVEFKIALNVLEKDSFSADLVIGLDFINKERLTVTYRPKDQQKVKETQPFAEILLHMDLGELTDDLESILDNCNVDFEKEIKSKWKQMVLEVANSPTTHLENDYYVKINIKDYSTYAYAPRRFAMAERIKIREITDNLLERGIIKPSSSAYCARVVPVRKKNGNMRLCVDLRPLNARVMKQKYPFPLIEDCLARLGNKKVFTLLDLRDGFHQIKVHPEYTKYFAFATPDGQFEYTRLPFGFCDSPAEFQRRIVQILQPFIRQDRVIVYIDDILIATDTVETNLETLKETMLLLK